MLLAALMAMAMQGPTAGAAAQGSALSGTLDTFKALCLASRAKGDAAVKSAEALGWTSPPSAMMANMPPTMKDMKNVQLRMSAPGKGSYVLITGNDADITNSGHPPSNDTCMVMGVNVGAADSTLKADVAKWMGGEPSATSGPLTIYGYTESAGARTILNYAQDKEAQQAFDKGQLYVVGLASQDPVNLIIYVVPTQAK
jgi:hypothetical protein